MGNKLIKPYKISLWEDKLIIPEEGESYYQEVKIADIGADNLDAPNKCFSPVLTKNINGETTFSFSVKFNYFDEELGEYVRNPLIPLLINERKVKLYYDKQWYDFLIKTCDEESEEGVFTYTATDAFVNELSKVGYNITFSSDLGNNQGTIIELGKKALENTDWVVDEVNSDLLQQTIEEGIYKCKVTTGSFSATNLTTKKTVTINNDEIIYVFYSFIENEKLNNFQFIREVDREQWTYDDHDSITATNYRLKTSATLKDNIIYIPKVADATAEIKVNELIYTNKAYRLTYDIKTVYDPVMAQTVKLYQAKLENATQDIYKSTTTDYNTSSLVTSYITNGQGFQGVEDATIPGWDAYNYVVSNNGQRVIPPLSYTTRPILTKESTELIPIDNLNMLRSFIRIKFPGTLINSGTEHTYANTYFNSGIMDHASTIGSISKGEKYAFRVCFGVSSSKDGKIVRRGVTQDRTRGVRAIVAFYNTKEFNVKDKGTVALRCIDPNNIILDFNGDFKVRNNIIKNGVFNSDKTAYLVDNVIQTPSANYVYYDLTDPETKRIIETGGSQLSVGYSWDAEARKFRKQDEDTEFLRYYITTATAKRSVSNKVLTNPANRIGIFLYTKDSGLVDKYTFISDIELFKYNTDNTGATILPNSAPKASAKTVSQFYFKPIEGIDKTEINMYSSKDDIASELGIDSDQIVAVYNTDSEKVLSIEESHSNCFNILQTLCETFECWLKINVEHESNGAIKLDNKRHPIKKIAFKRYIGKDNFAGFKYEINLNSIHRTIDSNEIVTKLIVQENPSDFAENGLLSIANAEANPSGEAYILNFDYYLKQGLIQNPEEFKKDLNTFYSQVKALNKAYQSEQKQYSSLANALTHAEAQRNVYVEAQETTNKLYIEALEKFKDLTGVSYSTYAHSSDARKEKIIKSDEARAAISDIYALSSVLNTYGGLVTLVEAQYKDLKLRCDGAVDYDITVSATNKQITSSGTIPACTKIILSECIKDLKFTLEDLDMTTIVFNSSMNEKEFKEEGEKPYAYIHFLKIPENYALEYTANNKTYTYTEKNTLKFEIYKGNNITTRFKLIPKPAYVEKYPGSKRYLEQLLEQKNKIVDNFNNKYIRFIKEGTWGETSYIDSNLYYIDALQVSRLSAQPQVSYDINVMDVSEIDGLENYNFDVGDKTFIEDTEFFGWNIILIGVDNIPVKTPVREEVVISMVEWHLDEPESNIITIQNYKTQFEDLFQRINATVQAVQYNEANYSRGASILDLYGNIDAKLLMNSLSNMTLTPESKNIAIAGGGAVSITNDGIVIKNLTDSKNSVRIISKGMEISQDGGKTWTEVVTSEGINTNSLTAGSINTQNIILMDGNNPSFRWDKYGISAYGFTEDELYDLNTFVRMDKYGLYGIKQGGDYVVTSLNDLKEKAHFAVTWDGFFIKNSYTDGYVSISSDDDFQIIANDQERIKIGALGTTVGQHYRYGMRINNAAGETVFETGDDGNLRITGTIYANAGEFTGTIHAQAGEFDGTITAHDGYIGGFTITDSLSTGTIGEDNSVVLSPGTISEEPIGGSSGSNAWAITAGNDFGVTTNGALYATSANITGTIHATDGEFTGQVNARGGSFSDKIMVGREHDKYIIIDSTGSDSIIASSDYMRNSSAGWMINGYGDAIFNNVSVRGAIKTAVFEYNEIEAVGGAFLFRPSTTIKSAIIDDNDLVLMVEKPLLFSQNEWVKLSNYNDDARALLNDGGLVHVYKISNNPRNDKVVRLQGAAAQFSDYTNAQIIQVDKYIIPGQQNEEVYTDPLDSSNIITTILDEDGLYSAELEDLNINNNSIYDINFNFEPYKKTSATIVISQNIYEDEKITDEGEPEDGRVPMGEVLPDIEPEEQEEEASTDDVDELSPYEVLKPTKIIERELVYIGNLDIISKNKEVSAEPFLIATIIRKTTYDENDNIIEEDLNPITKLFTINEGDFNLILEQRHIEEGIYDISDLEGGSIISFGFYNQDSSYENGIHNYGIGINSSDNYVNLPERAISLFETTIHPNNSVKVTYEYKGILGTLPPLGSDMVSNNLYNHYMAGTQGIFTNNMYIGDNKSYLAFYTDTDDIDSVTGQPKRKLRLVADEFKQRTNDDDLIDLGTIATSVSEAIKSQVTQYCISESSEQNTHKSAWFTSMPTPLDGEYIWQREYTVFIDGTESYVPNINGFYVTTAVGQQGPPGDDAIIVYIESNVGNEFILSQETATLTCTVYRGSTNVTSQVTKFLWTKNQANGTPDTTWNTAHEDYNLPYIQVTPSEINKKAVFGCRVTLPE